MSCAHENFNCFAAVARLQVSESDKRIGGYSVDVRIVCRDCGLPFEWVGIPCGSLPDRPAASFDYLELRAPIIPKGQTLPEMQRAGFLVKPPL